MKANLQKTTLLGITCVFFNLGLAQTTLYSENFEGTHSWTLNLVYFIKFCIKIYDKIR